MTRWKRFCGKGLRQVRIVRFTYRDGLRPTLQGLRCNQRPVLIHVERDMFDHLGIGVTSLAESKSFFLKALQPLGVTIAMEGPSGIGIGRNGKPSLWLSESPERPAHLHIAITAQSRTEVDEFYAAALAAGGKDNGPPGLRPHYHANYYGAFVIGPDGHNIEAVCHLPA